MSAVIRRSDGKYLAPTPAWEWKWSIDIRRAYVYQDAAAQRQLERTQRVNASEPYTYEVVTLKAKVLDVYVDRVVDRAKQLMKAQ